MLPGSVSGLCDGGGVVRTSAEIDELVAAEATAKDTGAAASESGQRATQFSGEMAGKVDEATNALMQHFQRIAEEMRASAQRAMSVLESADWQGRSREMAGQAERTLNARLDQVLVGAEEGTASFQQQMKAQASDFYDSVQGNFATIMSNVDVAFEDLAAAEAAFRDNLVAADQTIQAAG